MAKLIQEFRLIGSQADRDFNFILVYNGYLKSYLISYSIVCISGAPRKAELAYILLNSLLFGAPSILREFENNRREFQNPINGELGFIWNCLKMIHGKPCHSQSQISAECTNHDIKDIMAAQ